MLSGSFFDAAVPIMMQKKKNGTRETWHHQQNRIYAFFSFLRAFYTLASPIHTLRA